MAEKGTTADLDTILRRVRLLMEKAAHPSTPPAESKACEEKADALMFKYQVDAAMLDAARPAEARRKPIAKKIIVCRKSNAAHKWLLGLVNDIGQHCRVRVVTLDYAFIGPDQEIKAGVYGYEADVEFFNLMFTIIFMDLGAKLYPKWDDRIGEADNIARLHHSGLNWLDIARIKPDVMWTGTKSDPRPATLVGSRVKRTYQVWCKEQSPPVKPLITPNRVQFINSFTRSFALAIRDRFDEMARNRKPGSELVLANGMEQVNAWVNDLFGGELSSLDLVDRTTINREAALAGDRAGREVDLSGGRNRMQTQKKELS